jgi:hypothetical protein
VIKCNDPMPYFPFDTGWVQFLYGCMFASYFIISRKLCTPKYVFTLWYNCFYGPLTAFKLCSHIWEQKKGSFFTGVFLPQKSVLLPLIKTQYKHVSSYQVKSTPVWFVWAAPTLLTGAIIKNRPCIV